MLLLFYKKIKIRTKYRPEQIKQKLFDVSNNKIANQKIENLVLNDWNLRISFTTFRFQMVIGRKTQSWQRGGISSILKGYIKTSENSNETSISIIIRPTNQYIISLLIIILFIAIILWYGISRSITPVFVISSILLFLWYIFFLIDFNLQTNSLRQVINSCLNE